jgi:peroxiredoxin
MNDRHGPLVSPRYFVALILVGFFLVSVSGAAAAFKNVKVGDRAPAISLEDLDGAVHSLDDLKESKAVLLFFWATWSQRSLIELEDLAKIQEQYGDKGLSILAVNVENQAMDSEDLSQIKSVMEEKGANFTVVVDKGLKTYNEWGVIATPTTAIVDRDGNVIFDMSSYPTSGYLDVEEGVQKALGLFVEPEEKAADAVPAYQPTKQGMLHFGLGKRHLDKGFVSKAIPELEKSAVADSGYIEPVIYLGYAFLSDGNNAGAKEQLVKALAMDPERRETRLMLAHLLLGEQKLDEALDILQDVIPDEPAEESPAPETADETAQTGEAAAPAEESAARADTSSAAEAAPAEEAVVDAPENEDSPDKAIALKEQGKTEEALKVLDGYIAAELAAMGIKLEKKRQMSAMEKMKLMMQKKGPQQ